MSNYEKLYRLEHEKNQHLTQANLKLKKVIDLINQRGIKLIIPESTFSKEHIDIQLFTNCLSKDEFELIKEVLDL